MASETGPSIDVFAEAEAVVDRFGPRPPGSDAERGVAEHAAERLRALGREADVEQFPVWPQWAAAAAINAGVAIVGSVVSVSAAPLGAALVLAAAVLTVLDLSGVAPTTRRLLGRRASQNVISWAGPGSPGTLVLAAHLDSPPRALTRASTLPRPLIAALLLVLVCCLLRVAGLDGFGLTLVQFVATVALIVAVALLIALALADAGPGQNDNASGVALALRLAERVTLERYALAVVLTGSQTATSQGMRAFLRRHRDRLARDATVVVSLEAVGSGAVRFTRREGPLLPLRSHPQLVALCREVAEDTPDGAAAPTGRSAVSDAYAARSAGLAAITITGSDPSDRLDEDALAAAEAFSAELLARIDALSGG